MMNWTGGFLQRHQRGGGKALVEKQKAHFARARNRLPNPPSTASDFIPDLFAVSQARGKTTYPSNYGKSTRVDGRGSIRAFFESAQVNESSSVRPGTRNGSAMKTPEPCGGDDAPSRKHSRRTPDIISIRSSSASSGFSTKSAQQTRARQSEVVAMPTDEERIEAKRRHLLERGDWLGLAPTRPLRMNFEPSIGKDRVGRRRRVHRHAHLKRRQVTGPHLAVHQIPEEAFLMSGALPRNDIHIQVGSRALASQTEPSTVPSAKVESRISPARSSDSMLLGADDDNSVFEAIESFTEAANQNSAPEKIVFNRFASHDPEINNGWGSFVKVQGYEGNRGIHVAPDLESCPKRPDTSSALSVGMPETTHFVNQQERVVQSPCHADFRGLEHESHALGHHLVFTNTPRTNGAAWASTSPSQAPTSLVLGGDVHEVDEQIEDTELERQDHAWKRFLAVESTSTEGSTQPLRPARPLIPHEDSRASHSVSTPRGFGTQSTHIPSNHTDQTGRMLPRSNSPAAYCISNIDPSADVGKCEPPPTNVPHATHHPDDVWKTFVLGSDRNSPSSDESQPVMISMPLPTQALTQASMAVGYSLASEDLDNLGDSSPSTTYRNQGFTLEDNEEYDDQPDHSLIATSMSNNPPDSMQYGHVDRRMPQASAQNIHASAPSPIKSSFRSPKASSQRKGGLQKKMKQKASHQKVRDIYDIVDSDGNSL